MDQNGDNNEKAIKGYTPPPNQVTPPQTPPPAPPQSPSTSTSTPPNPPQKQGD